MRLYFTPTKGSFLVRNNGNTCLPKYSLNMKADLLHMLEMKIEQFEGKQFTHHSKAMSLTRAFKAWRHFLLVIPLTDIWLATIDLATQLWYIVDNPVWKYVQEHQGNSLESLHRRTQQPSNKACTGGLGTIHPRVNMMIREPWIKAWTGQPYNPAWDL